MTTIVTLPQVFRANAIDRFTRQAVRSDGRPTDDRFVFDFQKLDFIDGSGYTVLSNTLGWLQYHNAELRLRNFDDMNKEGIRYLDHCGFFRRHLGYALDNASRVRSTTLPCTSIEHARAFSWIEHSLSPWLGYALDASYGSLSSVRTCVKELFNNIADHAAVNTGYVHAQHYPSARQVKITVSDFGVGIPTTIRRRFGAMTDSEAIRYAAEEGVTAQSTPNNMGAGLNYLIDCVTANEGNVLIHSLSGSMNCFVDRRRQHRRPSLGRGSYPGTLVDITLDTRLFVGDEDERGEVEW
jgi:hypothetical protein